MKILATITPIFEPLAERWLAPSLRRLGHLDDLTLVIDHAPDAQGTGDFRSPSFDRHIVNKLETVATWAERESEPFLVTDADIIYLRPFRDLVLGLIGGADILLAREFVDRDDDYNIGQMVIRPSREVSAFMRQVAASLSGTDVRGRFGDDQPANQEHLNAELKRSELRHAPLPQTFAHTQLMRHLGPTRYGEVVSYHATETYPGPISSLDQKHQRLAEAARELGLDF